MNRNIFLIFLFTMLFYFQTDLALWPIYITDNKGFSLVFLGISQIIFVLTRFIFEVPSGVLSDRIGRIKVLKISVIASIVSNIFILFGQTMIQVALAYVLFGVSMAFISGTLEALLYDSIKIMGLESKYKYYNTNLYFMTMISFCAAMTFGGFIADVNMNYMYFANIFALSLALVVCFFMVEAPITDPVSNTVKAIIADAITTMKTNKKLLYLIAFITLTTAISNSVWNLSQKLLSQSGLSITEVSAEAIFTTMACGIAAEAGYFIEKKFGKMGSSIFVSLILVFPLILLGLTGNIYLMLTTLTLTTISLSFATPIYSDYVNSQVHSSSRATVLSIESLIISVLTTIFMAVLGLTNQIRSSFIIVGVIAIPVYLVLLLKIHSHQTLVSSKPIASSHTPNV